MSFTTLFRRNYYVAIPADLMKAAKTDGAGFFAALWADRPATLATNPDRHGYLAVHQYLERIPLRRHVHLRR